ncbi:hypothetical protein GGH92_010042 [Coemansia sp. RSA 2673]|nr:hypothetical protein GGH92_010042 [Coemansia sp. RSA 2673]
MHMLLLRLPDDAQAGVQLSLELIHEQIGGIAAIPKAQFWPVTETRIMGVVHVKVDQTFALGEDEHPLCAITMRDAASGAISEIFRANVPGLRDVFVPEFKKKRKQRFEEFKAAAKKLPRSERTAQKVKVKNQKKNEVPSHLVSEDDKAKKKLAHDAKVAAKRERRLKRKEVKRSKKIKKMAGVEERREKRVADKKARAAQEKATLAAGGPAK